MNNLSHKQLEWIPGSGRQEEEGGKIGANFLGTIKNNFKMFLVDLTAGAKEPINLRITAYQNEYEKLSAFRKNLINSYID